MVLADGVGAIVWGIYVYGYKLGTMVAIQGYLNATVIVSFISIYDYKSPIFWWALPAGQQAKSQIINSSGLVHRRQQ